MSALVLVVFVATVAAMVAVIVLFFLSRKRMSAPISIQASHVRVLGVREIPVGDRTQHWVELQFTDGHKREFLATPSQADVIFRGQSGQAHFAGDRLTGWVPEIGGVQDSYSSDQG